MLCENHVRYYWVYAHHGLSFSDIVLQGDNHFKPNLPSDTDAFCTGSRCYSREEQETIAGQGTAAWYITLIMSQAAHIWLVKSATVSVFSISPFNNIVSRSCLLYFVDVAVKIERYLSLTHFYIAI